MLTPLAIDEQQFGRQFKGYDVDEVDDFLEQVANDYETLMINNKEQEDKIRELEVKLEALTANQGLLQETLVIAKKSADEIVRKAEEEAEAIKKEAKEYVNERTGNIEDIIEKKQEILSKLEADTEMYKTKLQAMLIAQLDLLKNLDD